MALISPRWRAASSSALILRLRTITWVGLITVLISDAAESSRNKKDLTQRGSPHCTGYPLCYPAKIPIFIRELVTQLKLCFYW